MSDYYLKITVIVGGIPEKNEFSADIKIIEAIRKMLDSSEKQNAKNYELRNSTQDVLDPNKSLKDNGVKDDDTLSLTKKHGGGGSHYPFQS